MLLSIALAAPGLLEPTTVIPGDHPLAFDAVYPSTLCDVDGDGLADLVLSELPVDDAPVLTVWFGTSAGLPATYDQRFEPPAPSELGHAPACVGDVDGDGFEDVAVSGLDGVHIVSGSTTGLGEVAASLPGTMAAPAGDIDGDGHDDVLVTIFPPDVATHLHLGGPGGLDPAASWQVRPPGLGTMGPVTAGDLNHDGYSDLVVAWSEPTRVEVYFGGAAGPGPAVAGPALDPAYDVGGLVVADVDLDGFDDLFTHTRFSGYGFSDQVTTLNHGWAAGLDPLAHPSPELPIDVGDYDGDGQPEMRAPLAWYPVTGGLPGAEPSWLQAHSGSSPPSRDIDGDGLPDAVHVLDDRVVAYFGAAVPRTVPLDWQPNDDHDTHVVTAAGDLDGDGIEDLLVGSYALAFFAGTPTGPELVAASDLELGTSTERTGVGLGDLDGDGYGDAALGLPHGGPDRHGTLLLLEGGPSGPTPAGAYTSPHPGVQLGTRMVSGDFDGDGLADVAAAQGDASGAHERPGLVRVFFAADGLFESAPVTLSGQAEGDRFGRGLAAGDWNGDGFDDLLVGSPGFGGSTVPAEAAGGPGRLELFLGSASGLQAGWSLQGIDQEELGADVALLDIDGDSEAEALATTDHDGIMELHLYDDPSVPPTSPVDVLSFPSLGPTDEPRLLSVGDLDGDGGEDLVVHRRASAGGTTLHLSDGTGIDPVPLWTAPQGLEASIHTLQVSSGDVDGDGMVDLLLGHDLGAMVVGGATILGVVEPLDTGTPIDTGTVDTGSVEAPTPRSSTTTPASHPKAQESGGCGCASTPAGWRSWLGRRR